MAGGTALTSRLYKIKLNVLALPRIHIFGNHNVAFLAEIYWVSSEGYSGFVMWRQIFNYIRSDYNTASPTGSGFF